MSMSASASAGGVDNGVNDGAGNGGGDGVPVYDLEVGSSSGSGSAGPSMVPLLGSEAAGWGDGGAASTSVSGGVSAVVAAARSLSTRVQAAAAVVAAVIALCGIAVAFRDGGVVVIVLAVGAGGAVFAAWLGLWVLALPQGPSSMAPIARYIREGAEGFFATQYKAIGRISVVTALGVALLYLFRPQSDSAVALSNWVFAATAAASFLVGAACSGFAGYVGMWMAVRANVRVAASATRSYNGAIQAALRGGAFSGLLVVTLVVIGLTSLYVVNRLLHPSLPAHHIPHLMTGFGFGASLVALFAQVGGGIYTKAADVGADLVGKVEASIPEDDPRNPAVIADLVGDNVGDCAGRGADLFESISAEIIGSMIIGGALANELGLPSSVSFMFFPLVVHSIDIIVSSVGVMVVKTSAAAVEDPLTVLKRGYMAASILASAGMTVSTYTLLSAEEYPSAWWHFALCGYLGQAVSLAFVYMTQYYTDTRYGPVWAIAEASASGHGTNVIMGVAKGMESTAGPVMVISLGVLGSYWLGEHALPGGGLFGTAVATMGMLSSAVYVLAMDTFGPIADNAGGIVEMSQQGADVRAITDSLDAVGNVTKAVTKGYGVGSAGLAAFLLFRAFMDVVSEYTGEPFEVVNFASPPVFVGGLLGGGLVFLFSAWTMAAVGKTAALVVAEVREQFAERPGILDHSQEPDYSRCVAIVAKASLVEMIWPGGLAVCAPVVIGFAFKLGGVGATALSGFLMITTIVGILLSLTLNNAGGAWDNAKKLVETGEFGGRGSEAHAASVTGDTVGDPFKDTAGPSLHVLIKLVATVGLVIAPLVL